MLRKLMKYELMATGRVFLPLFVALVILSFVNRLLSYLPAETPQFIGMLVVVMLIIGIMALVFILTLQRFRNNLLSNEGHLMMTLPVSTNKLILSKLFVATIWVAASLFVVTLSILIMGLPRAGFTELAALIGDYIKLWGLKPLHVTIYTIEAVFGFIISVFTGILMLYTCMSTSMLVDRRRGLFTFGAFIVISIIMQTLLASALSVIDILDIDVFFGNIFRGLTSFGQSQLILLIWFVIDAVVCVVFFTITRFMLKNRLNLQ